MERRFDRLLWVIGVNEPEDKKPILVGIDGDTMHWHAGMTRCAWIPERWKIVREYPWSSYKDVHKAENDLLTEYAPKPQPPCARLGYISPEGDFYPCGYCCHKDLEAILGEIIYDESYYCDLERKGWVALKGGALICTDRDDSLTEAAKTTLRKVIEAFELAEAENPNINWQPILLANPEGYDEQNWFTSPTELWDKDKTYAQKLRESYELFWGEGDTQVEELVVPDAYNNVVSNRLDAHPGD